MPVPTPDPNAEWWTTTDVAHYLDVEVSTVSTYRSRGQMPDPDRQIGRAWLWKPRRIIDWHTARPASRNVTTRYRRRRPGQRATEFTLDLGIAWDDYRLDKRFETIEAEGEVAELLELGPGTPVLARHFVFYAGDTPQQMSTSCVPLHLVEGTPVADPDNEPWPGGTVAQFATLDIVITDVEETITARLPTDEETATLHIPPGVPVFDVRRRMLAGDTPVEAAVPIVMPADRYRLTYRTPV